MISQSLSWSMARQSFPGGRTVVIESAATMALTTASSTDSTAAR